MRLIDTDALIKSMKSHTVEDNGLTDDYKAGLTDSMRTAVALAENAPTIDAVPVVRGEWVAFDPLNTERPYNWVCSNCGCGCVDYRTAYCHDCGAKMNV